MQPSALTKMHLLKCSIPPQCNCQLDCVKNKETKFYRFFLPPIILYAGLSVRKKAFFRNLPTIATLGILGTYVAFAVIVVTLYGFSKFINITLAVSSYSINLCKLDCLPLPQRRTLRVQSCCQGVGHVRRTVWHWGQYLPQQTAWLCFKCWNRTAHHSCSTWSLEKALSMTPPLWHCFALCRCALSGAIAIERVKHVIFIH